MNNKERERGGVLGGRFYVKYVRERERERRKGGRNGRGDE